MVKSIAVSIPTYNRPGDLRKLVNSIPDKYKVFISNNGSTLKSQDFRENVVVENLDSPIEMFENWNNAVNISDGEYFLIPSDDDIYYEGAFEAVEKAVSSFPECDVFLWGVDLVDAQYSRIRSLDFGNYEAGIFKGGELFNRFSSSLPFRMPCICFKKSFFDSLGGFDTEKKITASDSELIHKALISGCVYIDSHVIGGYRVWDKSLTSATNTKPQWFEELDLWVNGVRDFSKSIDKESLIPKDYRRKILYQNLCSGMSSLINAKRSVRDRVKFVLWAKQSGYFESLKDFMKLTLRALIGRNRKS